MFALHGVRVVGFGVGVVIVPFRVVDGHVLEAALAVLP